MRLIPQMTAEPMEDLARRVRARVERHGEIGNPVVVPDELFFRGVGIVDAIDPILGERRVVGVRRSEEVMLAARLVEIVIEVGAGRHEAVDVPVSDEVRHDHSEAARGQRARHSEKNRHVVIEHLQPHAVRGGEIAPLKRDPLHARQDLVAGEPCLHCEWFHRRLQEA